MHIRLDATADAPAAMQHASATAAALRDRRSRTAQLLTATRQRAHLDWAELTQLPDWAFGSDGHIATLALAVGALQYANELRRCIDGRVLTMLRTRLGAPAFAALMRLPLKPAVGASQPLEALLHTPDPSLLPLAVMSPPQLEARLLCTGRECLLASIEATTLRQALRERWLDETSGARGARGETGLAQATVKPPPGAAAQALVELALSYFPAAKLAPVAAETASEAASETASTPS